MSETYQEAKSSMEEALGLDREASSFPTAPGESLLGQEIEAYVKLYSLRFPKKKLEEWMPGEFAIIGLSIVSLEKGALPEEMNYGTPERQNFNGVIAKGRVPQLEFGVVYYFRGVLTDDARFGLQYNIQEFHKIYNMVTPQQKETFLRIVFSPSKAQLLLENFEDPTVVLEKGDVKALCEIKGIQETTAQKMIETYQKNLSQGDVLIQLAEYNLTQYQIDSMLHVYKSVDTVIWFLQHDPYAFISTVKGIGWEKADTIGINNGVNPCGTQRIAAFINYYLESQAQNIGHLWVNLSELAAAVDGIAPRLDPVELRDMLNRWTGRTEGYDGPQWLYYDEQNARIGLMYYRKMEEEIAHELMRIQHATNKLYDSEEIENAIERAELDCGFEYTEEQRDAMRLCFNNNLVCITGSAGTGKTTSVKPIVDAIKYANGSFCQCALSGKASSNLEEITGQKGYTIHRLLGWNPLSNKFQYDENHRLHTDMVIVDEISMVEDSIFLSLLKAIPSGAKLILLGDIQQLEAIGPGAIALDLLRSPMVQSKCLTKIHRQAAASGIVTESLKAARGEQIIQNLPVIETRGDLQDIKIRSYSDAILTSDYIMEEYTGLYNQGVKPRDLTVIVPMKERGGACCYALNQKIQELVNASCPGIPEVTVGTKEKPVTLRKYDKIIITTNHYRECFSMEVDVTQKITDEILKKSVPIYNGNTGFLVDIKGKYLIVDLTVQGLVQIPKKYWKDVNLGYALTAHKYQGSASPYVIVGLDSAAYNLLSKEWVYTALTRAKKYCVFVAQISAARMAVSTTRVLHKHTWLQELLLKADSWWTEAKKQNNIDYEYISLREYKYWPESISRAEQQFKINIKDNVEGD